MNKNKTDKTFENKEFEILIKKCKEKNLNTELIIKAYNYAKLKHEGQKRKGGRDFITHPLNVALLLLKLENSSINSNLICAGLLHDALEDTNTTMKELEKEFNKNIAFLVEAVSYKNNKISKEEKDKIFREKIESKGKKDERVFFLKIMDRLHNMQTINHLNIEQQKRISRETLNYFVPLAKKIGLKKIAVELELLSKNILF